MVMPSPTQLQTPPTPTFGEFFYFFIFYFLFFIFYFLFFVGCFVYFLFRIFLFFILWNFERKSLFHPLHRRKHPALQCTFCTQHLKARVGGNQHTTGKRVGLAWCLLFPLGNHPHKPTHPKGPRGISAPEFRTLSVAPKTALRLCNVWHNQLPIQDNPRLNNVYRNLEWIG